MNCNDVRDLLTQPDGPTAEQFEALASHLDTCAECQALAEHDRLADHAEWRQALLEASDASSAGQLLGGPDSFARKVFDHVWPQVQREYQEQRLSPVSEGVAANMPTQSPDEGRPVARQAYLEGVLRALDGPSAPPLWTRDPWTNALRRVLDVVQGGFEFRENVPAPADGFLGSEEECYTLHINGVLRELSLQEVFSDLLLIVMMGASSRMSLRIEPANLLAVAARRVEVQVRILDRSGGSILAAPLRIEPGRSNEMLNVPVVLRCEPDEFEGSIEVVVREIADESHD